MRRNLPLFLNVHPCELAEPWLLAQDDPIYQHEPPVYLEITESVPLSQLAECRVLLHRLRRRGIHVVVDNLGAGYSNLRYLAELQPRLVNFDRALISGLRVGTRMYRLVAGLVVLCKALDAEVVAEGIEMTAKAYLAVQEAGVQYGQGYLFARPELSGATSPVAGSGSWARAYAGGPPAGRTREPRAAPGRSHGQGGCRRHATLEQPRGGARRVGGPLVRQPSGRRRGLRGLRPSAMMAVGTAGGRGSSVRWHAPTTASSGGGPAG